MANENQHTYFGKLNDSLKDYHRAVPYLLIDLEIVDQNIDIFKSNLKPATDFRIVVKSLPSLSLINYIMERMNTNNLMVFHQPFLTDLIKTLSERADILLGKPMPIKTAAYFYKNLPTLKNNFNPYQQIQWLVDTQDRMSQYIELSKNLGMKLRLNLEIDVGLHRGGFQDLEDLRKALSLIKANQRHVIFSGFMGYDPHVVRIPKVIRSQKVSRNKSNAFYMNCINFVKDKFNELWRDDLTFNGAGSPTVSLHNTTSSPLNDIAAGSCFVKPSSFDIPSLKNYQPACFIATPILKKMKFTALPGLEKIKSLYNFLNPCQAQSFFIYGGFWKAKYHYPKNLSANKIFGESTNQTMINAPKKTNLEVDDYVFLRPNQSEFVFLQFGKLLICRGNKIINEWDLLNNY